MKVVIIISVLLLTLLASCNSRYDKLKTEGDELVILIEKFRQTNGHLPVSVSDLGLKESLKGPIYYERLDSNTYILWFGKELGESTTYYSGKKEWK